MSEQENKETLVLIPCHNEEGRVGGVISSIKNTLPAADIVVINDASSDNSAEEALKAGATVLTHGSNLGYGAALETGFLYAVNKDYQLIFQMDGDGQHLAEELPKLIEALKSKIKPADIVIGSRYSGKEKTCHTPFIKKIGHKLLSYLIFTFTGMRLTDPTSGFQLLNRRALTFFSSGVFPCDYPDSDVILMAHMSGLRIHEVPVIMKERVSGKSMHAGLAPLYYAIKMLLAIFVVVLNLRKWLKWRREHRSD